MRFPHKNTVTNYRVRVRRIPNTDDSLPEEPAAVVDVVAEGHPGAEAAAAAFEQRLLAVHTAASDVLQLQVAQFLAADVAVGIVAVQAAPL
jgi:hypothetical protein